MKPPHIVSTHAVSLTSSSFFLRRWTRFSFALVILYQPLASECRHTLIKLTITLGPLRDTYQYLLCCCHYFRDKLPKSDQFIQSQDLFRAYSRDLFIDKTWDSFRIFFQHFPRDSFQIIFPDYSIDPSLVSAGNFFRDSGKNCFRIFVRNSGIPSDMFAKLSGIQKRKDPDKLTNTNVNCCKNKDDRRFSHEKGQNPWPQFWVE